MLTRDVARVWELGNVTAWPLAPQSALFQGSAVGDNGSGCARPLQAGDKFLGFCEAFTTNLPLSPDVPAPQEEATFVRILSSGIVELDVAGVKATAFGLPVYASDDASFTLSGPPNSFVGTVHRVLLSGKTLVAFGHQVRACVASHTIVFAGSHKTTGGNVLEKMALPGLLASDVVHVQLSNVGKKPCMLQAAAAALNSVQLTFDNDPGNDTVFSYVVTRSLNEGEKK
jgi:hypothetical protein